MAQSAFTGGSSKTVKVVQQSDLDAAAAKLTTDNSDSAKADLTGQFGKGFTVIDSSFNAAAGTPTSTPAVGAELDSGQATVSLTTTYTMLGLNNADLNNLLNSQALAGVDNSANQKVYDNGLSNLKFSNYNALDGGKASVRLIATAKVGPKLDEDKIKQESVGLRAGEIQQLLSKTDGVDSVNVHFSPFWVNKAPKVDKITVEFDVSK
ncbi:MAG: hypothetical protein LBM73_03360 [Candidatus Nomurabacteria bacterium]|nr:hypothetical protein [Candidatus Nomurabacteria bacterium]